MKILFTCFSNSWGGLEMYTLTILLQLKKRNCEIDLLCLKNSRLSAEAKKVNINTFEIESTFYFNPLFIYRLASLINRNKYTIVHSHASKDLWFIVPALKFSKNNIPLHFTKHVASGIKKNDALHKFLYNRIDKAYAISKMIQSNLAETTPIKKERIFLLYNGIDTGRFNPAIIDRKKFRNELLIKDDELLIGMIGRFSPGKGHEEFIDSAQLLLGKFHNIRFVIVGEASKGEDEYFNRIKQRAQKIKGSDKLIFTGYRKDIPEIFAALDIFVFPSHDESFGLTLVEGMSMEKPNVCTRASGVLEIAIDNKTSLLFERENVNEMVSKLSQLIESSELRNNMGIDARKRAKELFDIENYTTRLINFYNN